MASLRAKALLIDLDNTLVPELANYSAAFAGTCRDLARERAIELTKLRDAVFGAALDRWLASPVADWCARIGIGSPTSLLSDFPGDAPELAFLRGWAPDYRRASWTDGLRAAGLRDADALAIPLSDDFRQRIREHCPAYADAPAAVETLARTYTLGIATNGPADVQRIKLTVSGLRRFFPVVVASSDVGAGKPDPRIFAAAVERLRVSPEDVLVVGDSLAKDVAGAHAAGLRCVWVDRTGAERDQACVPDAEVRSLAELPALLA
ncbi:MAG: HAD family hydrolase [Chloroflexota bacterium]|nr:HAD family hydrolase [Chloroflexota bacterium]